MKFRWNIDKSTRLHETRNISAEVFVETVSTHGVLDILNNPNYQNQIYVLIVFKSYVYVAACLVEAEDCLFIKSIWPSRKATRKYLNNIN